jgi:hypothetical protein
MVLFLVLLRGTYFAESVYRKILPFESNIMLEMEPTEGSRNIAAYLPLAQRTSQLAYNSLASS